MLPQPELTSDAIDDEITLEPSQNKQKMRSLSAQNPTITLLETDIFDGFVAKQPHLGYENRTNLTEKPVEAPPVFLRALTCFSRNPLRDPENGPSFSLAQ